MEHLGAFGDPFSFFFGEDLIAFKLEAPWTQDAPVPSGCSLNSDRLVLRTNKASFVAAKTALLRAPISQALFAGCASFASSDAFRRAAGQLLKDANKIVIVHNSDDVLVLIGLFPKAEVLALLDDFAVHISGLERRSRAKASLEAGSSKLRELVGNSAGMGADFLLMSPQTVSAILYACPELRRLDSPLVHTLVSRLAAASSSVASSTARNFQHLRLGVAFGTGTGDVEMLPVLAPMIASATSMFTSVRHLEVAIMSLEDFASLSAFADLRSLSATFPAVDCLVDVGTALGQLLNKWPLLEKLSLGGCSAVRLSVISQHCPMLVSLRLVRCEGPQEDDSAVAADAFPQLVCADLKVKILTATFRSFFAAICENLHSLRLGDDGMCAGFLKLCSRESSKLVFPRLKSLVLSTQRTVQGLGLIPEDFHVVSKAMPMLKRIATDSYGIRLFFEHYGVQRGSVSVMWCGCMYCAVHLHNARSIAQVTKKLDAINKAVLFGVH